MVQLPHRVPLLPAALAALVLGPPALAMWAMLPRIPLSRVLPNLERAVEERPDDAAAHFVLGRVHGYAFATCSERVTARLPRRAIMTRSHGELEEGDEPLPIEGVYGPWLQHRRTGERLASDRSRARHLEQAIHHLRRALELDPEPAEHHLGLAYVLDVGASHAHLVDSVAALGLMPAPPSGQGKPEELSRWLRSPVAPFRHVTWRELAQRGDDIVPLLHAARDDEDPVMRAEVRLLLAERWRAHAAAGYLRAYEIARAVEPVGDDLPQQEFLQGGLREQFMSYEAAESWLRLVDRHPPASDADRAQRVEVAAFLAHVESAPPSGVVTPIMFSLAGAHAVADLEALLAPERIVAFDLDGDGLVERRPWLAPDTALLCWDPDGSGAITSGRQLFGNATWWLLFADGYQALDALDDDRDGWLTRDELTGLAIWRDADQDAVSDPGEVTDAREAGITALATRASTRVDIHPAAEDGLHLTDGRQLPTWDWIAPPAPTVTAEP